MRLIRQMIMDCIHHCFEPIPFIVHQVRNLSQINKTYFGRGTIFKCLLADPI